MQVLLDNNINQILTNENIVNNSPKSCLMIDQQSS